MLQRAPPALATDVQYTTSETNSNHHVDSRCCRMSASRPPAMLPAAFFSALHREVLQLAAPAGPSSALDPHLPALFNERMFMPGWKSIVFGAVIGVCACTKENPAAKCSANGTCTDPAFPFCDVDGSVAGNPGACIAVACTSGQFKSCVDGNTALVCDSTGSTYTHTPCVNGCDPTTGCITCTPNTATCSNGSAISCDGGGVLSSETCGLGCSTTTPTRCTRIVPSNNLGTYYGGGNPVDLNLASGSLDLDTSMFDDGSGNITTLPSYDVAATSGGAPMRVFVVKHLTLGNVLIMSSTAAQDVNEGVGRAAAFVATDDINITGRVSVQTGAVSIGGCNGGDGGRNSTYDGGGGGGAFANSGGAGGDAPGGTTGGSGGLFSNTPELVPLRGGCPGGTNTNFAGGAIQLVSMTAIHVTGIIDADAHGAHVRAGGGGGGGILLEAPAVTVDSTGKLLARGGGGGAGYGSTANAPTPADDGSAPPGGTCTPATAACGAGGVGGNGSITAKKGGTATQTGVNSYGGGGGGGVGTIRVNTIDGNFTPTAGSVVAGSLTVGTLGTI